MDTRPELQQFLGHRYGIGSVLGFETHWTANVVRAMGSYGKSLIAIFATSRPCTRSAVKTGYGPREGCSLRCP